MTDAPELKPCPFCGGEADFESVGMDSRTVWYRVVCSTGCCAGSAPHETCEEATVAWNTRADTITALEAENQRLLDALSVAMKKLTPGIPGDSRAVPDWFVACAAVQCGLDDDDGRVAECLRAALEGE